MEGLVLVVTVVGGMPFLLLAIWAIATRPPWWRLRDSIYALLLQLGIFFAWCAFIYVFRPDTVFGVISFLAPSYGCFLVHKKFAA